MALLYTRCTQIVMINGCALAKQCVGTAVIKARLFSSYVPVSQMCFVRSTANVFAGHLNHHNGVLNLRLFHASRCFAIEHQSSRIFTKDKYSRHRSVKRDLLKRDSRLLSLASNPAPNTIANDLSLAIGKRLARRPKIKESPSRDQDTLYMANAFATAEEYNLEALSEDFKCYGYKLVDLPADAFDSLHIEAKHPASDEPRRIFFFREGSVVFWNVPKDEQQVWLQHLRPHQDGTYNISMIQDQEEEMDFSYSTTKTQLKDGEIELRQFDMEDDPPATLLDMYAFSNALSLSVKLSVWEALLNEYVDSIEVVLQDLKDGKKIRISEADALRKAGELFTLSHFINLSSDLLDTPDFYWDREDLGRLYNKTCNYLNISRRTRVMNEKLDQCMEIIELLRDHLKDKHHTRLEWMIIALISVEVGFAVFHLFERYFWNEKNETV